MKSAWRRSLQLSLSNAHAQRFADRHFRAPNGEPVDTLTHTHIGMRYLAANILQYIHAALPL